MSWPRKNRRRDEEIYNLRRKQGLTFRQIGERFNISSGRAQQVFLKHGREVRYERRRARMIAKAGNLDACSINVLSLNVRAANVLNNAGILTVGELRSIPQSRLLKFRNCGPDTIKNIRNALQAVCQPN